LNTILTSKAIDEEDRIWVSDIVHRMGKLPESVYMPVDVWELSDDQVTELAAAVQAVAEHDARLRSALRYWERSRGQTLE
jgi:hypothetical protein